MITTIYTIALLAIFTICMIVIFKKTSITSKVNKEKQTHLEVEQLKSKIDALRANSFRLIEESHDKSKRIAELIELCDKLQPDLVKRNITISDLPKQLNTWYLDKGLERAAKVDICKWIHNFTLTQNGIENSRFEAVDNIVFKEIKTVDKSKIKIEEPDE